MKHRNQFVHRSSRKRAVIAAQVCVLLVVMLGFASLTVDVGAMYNTRADLQRAADAAALAGTAAYASDDMMRVRMDGDSDSFGLVVSDATGLAQGLSFENKTLGAGGTIALLGDIRTGWIDLYSSTADVNTASLPADFNAIEVIVRRDGAEGGNGAMTLFFANIFGRGSTTLVARAVAVYDDRYGGIRIDPDTHMLPFTIHEDAFEQDLANGGDSYSWNEGGETVSNDPDGIREIRLYPYPLSGSGYTEGDGNFGILNIGTGNQGVSAEQVQIENGVTADDFVQEIGTSDLTFFDDSGSPTTYDMTGSPGLEATLKTTLSNIVGQVVGFFLHDNVILSGSNAIYTITQIRFGRVMDVRLTGNPNKRGLYIQPVSYSGSQIWIENDAPSSGGLVGRFVLAR